MQFSGRIEAIFERGQSPPEENVREVPLLFISKPYYENSQYVYMLRQEFAQLDIHAQPSHLSHALSHTAEPNALLLLGGLMIHDRAQKRITLSNQTVLYYQHLIFFSSLVVEGEVRAPDLSLGTLQAFAAALKYHSMRPILWNDPLPPALSSSSPPLPSTSIQTPDSSNHPLHAFFLAQFSHLQVTHSITLYENPKSHWIFELQP